MPRVCYHVVSLSPALVVITVVFCNTCCKATPPAYVTFERRQQVDYEPDPMSLVRIWVAFVEQGDGILIQLPRKSNYIMGDGESERIDVLVDGGSRPASESWRIGKLVRDLYGQSPTTIEHAIVTHHDQDHVVGITNLLNDERVDFETIYHNGLASYRGGQPTRQGIDPFPEDQPPEKPAIFKFRDNLMRRGMAFVFPPEHDRAGELDPGYLISDSSDLRRSFVSGEFQGIYDRLAAAVVNGVTSGRVSAFSRAFVGAPFVNETEIELDRGGEPLDVTFDVIWPLEQLRPYGGRSWSETINGNSITFRLSYGEFQMLFTGDHNEKSEKAILAHLRSTGSTESLHCDVMKVPHHGSSHAHEPFFRPDGFRPVLSVASMGNQGFKSKAMYSRNWEHPSTEVISWLGGPHRVYHTFVHERRFKWSAVDTEAKRQALIERKHVLIETDGEWFRVVEVPADAVASLHIPSVRQTRRGNGTQWIRAVTEGE